MIALAAIIVAHSAPLPDAPVFERTAPAGCQAVIGVDPGDEAPSAVFSAEGARCSYVLVPVDIHADLLAWRRHAQQVRDLHIIHTTELRAQMSEGFAWRDQRIAALEEPPPFFQRPATQRIIGIVEATATVTLGIVAVNHSQRI